MTRITRPLILVAVALAPAEGRTQSTSANDRATRDSLAVEVRLLRQAVEKQTAVAARSQLLVTRLAVQFQRVVRAQDAVDRIAEAADAADSKQEHTRQAIAKANRALANVIEEPQRSELEREIETLRGDLIEHDRQVSRLRTRRSQAEQSLRTEERSYGELEASLNDLDRELQRPAP